MKANWVEIKEAYQRGEGSCRELAERFGVSHSTIMKRCAKEKWKIQAEEINRKVEEKIVEKVSDAAAEYIKRKLKRIERCEKDIDASRNQFPTDEEGAVVMDMLNVKHMLQAEAQADEITRKALGIPDTPQRIEVSLDITERLLAARRRVKKLNE